MTKKIGIIGGGPAGLTAAIESSKAGLDVTLWEKSKIGKNINCAEGYFDLLNLTNPPSSGIQHKVNKVIIKTEANKKYNINTENLNLWMIDRKTWQKDLAKKALERGVKIKESCKINKEKLINLKQNYDYILDGSGVPSITSVYYGFKSCYLNNALITVQYRIKGDFSHFKETIEVVLLENIPGYAWIFPKNRVTANIGLGKYIFDNSETVRGNNLYKKLNKFIYNYDIKGKISGKSAGICPSKLIKPLIYDNVFLIGDAAGLTSPLHGGGLDLAVFSSKLAVKCITQKQPKKYYELLNKNISSKITMEKYIKNLWLNKNRNKFEKFLFIISKLENNTKLISFLSRHHYIFI